MYQSILKDSPIYFDCTNPSVYMSYISKTYEKLTFPDSNIESQSINLLQCQYCQVIFPNQDKKIRHLGYCFVNFKHVLQETKLKQLKITNYLDEDTTYQADSENSIEMDGIITSSPPKKTNTDSLTIEMDNMTKMMKCLETFDKKKSQLKKKYNTNRNKYNIRKVKSTSTSSLVRKENQKKKFKQVRKSKVRK